MAPFPIKLLAIDDQKIVYKAIEGFIKGEQDIFLKTVDQPNLALSIAEEFEPTVIVLDLIMPQIDGLILLRYFQEHPKLKEVPVIMLSSTLDAKTKAEAFQEGAADYMVKFPEKEEFVARLRHHAAVYYKQQEQKTAEQQLMQSEQGLKQELTAAATYIQSQLPPPMNDRVTISWRYKPAATLGGDVFGYSFIDSNHLLLYIIDVAGHGVKAALHSVAVLHAIHRLCAEQAKELLHPKELLMLLNKEFPMEQYDNAFATIWYGVVDLENKKLTYASAGAPPQIFLPSVTELGATGMPLGISAKAVYEEKKVSLQENELLLFTDGLWELEKEDGTFTTYDEFLRILRQPELPNIATVDRLLHWAEHVRHGKPFQDDICLIHIVLTKKQKNQEELLTDFDS